jgi:hypothetical protein
VQAVLTEPSWPKVDRVHGTPSWTSNEPSLRWGASSVCGHQGALRHGHLDAGALAGDANGVSAHLETGGPVGRVVAIEIAGFVHSDQPERLIAPMPGDFLSRLIADWDLGAPHVVGPDVGTVAAPSLAAKSPEPVVSRSGEERSRFRSRRRNALAGDRGSCQLNDEDVASVFDLSAKIDCE